MGGDGLNTMGMGLKLTGMGGDRVRSLSLCSSLVHNTRNLSCDTCVQDKLCSAFLRPVGLLFFLNFSVFFLLSSVCV